MASLPEGIYVFDDDVTPVEYAEYVYDPFGALVEITEFDLKTGIQPTVPSGDWRSNDLLDPGPNRVVWGMFTSTGDSLDQLETLWGADINLTRLYTGGGDIISGTASAQTHLNNGRVPMISVNWKNELKTYVTAHMTNIGGSGLTLPGYMAAGHFDGDPTTGLVTISGLGTVPGFRALARTIKALTPGQCPTNRVVLTPWHEFENADESGFGFVKTTAGFGEFRAAWQQMRAVFDEEGVTNVTWGFCGATGVSSWGATMTDTASTGFYPGHNYVDFVMYDPYNSSGLQQCDGTLNSRSNNAWLDFGLTGDRGDGKTGANSSVLNRWGQMTWWFQNFALDGAKNHASAAVGQGVYKPVWLGECGTGEHSLSAPTDTTKQAIVWWDRMATWLTWALGPDGPGTPVRGICYYHNNFNQVTCSGSMRRQGFTGRGTNAVWATIAD